jgi:hypothetical protein
MMHSKYSIETFTLDIPVPWWWEREGYIELVDYEPGYNFHYHVFNEDGEEVKEISESERKKIVEYLGEYMDNYLADLKLNYELRIRGLI